MSNRKQILPLDDIGKLLSEVKKLRELLDTASAYMGHMPTCPIILRDCDCGFAEIKKQIEEALK